MNNYINYTATLPFAFFCLQKHTCSLKNSTLQFSEGSDNIFGKFSSNGPAENPVVCQTNRQSMWCMNVK